jgi:serine/threonine protein kinase
MNEVPPIVVSAGLRVGEFVLDEKIGQGAFGEVWKAHHKAWTDQLAAVKIPTDPAYVRHIQSEGFSLHRLSHPNVVRLIGFDPTGTPPYLISELVEGSSLRQVLSKGKLSVPHAVAIMRQVLAGLAYAHGQNVVHGDLKPSNVLIEKNAEASGYEGDGVVKLADFGVGKVSATVAPGGASSSLFRGDRSGSVATLAYIAPEQHDGAAPDAKSDLFACGVILFELLTSERPAGAESPSELNPDVPPSLDGVFRHAYARRERRFASAVDFLAALNQALKTGALPPKGDPTVIAVRPDDVPTPVIADAPIPIQPEPIETVVEAPPPPPPAPVVAEVPAPPPKPPVKPAQRGIIVIDETARKPLRTADELRNLFNRIYLMRNLDRGEVGNLRLRLDQWAEAAGGMPGFGEKVDVTEALDCPYYRVIVKTDYEQDEGAHEAPTNEGAVMLANPSASQDCGQELGAGDFMQLLHISSGAFPPIILDLIGVTVIRVAVANLLTAAKAQAHGRPIARQELKILRANVLSLRYMHEAAEHGVCFAGSNLKVVTPLTPITRMRDDLLKRAASLLDSENIGAGINELRQMFETANAAQPRAERMLVALRAKLSAAYMALADTTVGSLGIFESLVYSNHAAELLPSNDTVGRHERRIARLAFWVHAGPGIVIGAVFAIIASYNHPVHINYIAAAVGAIVAGILNWSMLRSRLSRTDAGFCHACLLPLAVAAILATILVDVDVASTTTAHKIERYVATAIMLGIVAFAERWIFNNYGFWLFRPQFRQNLVGTPLDILNQIHTMIEQDWDRLREHYVALEPLYKHASAKLSAEESGINVPETGEAPDLD